MATKKIIAYKGFNQDMTCRGYQFEVGKTYKHEGEVKACESGFHSCEYPLDVFSYYAPAQSVFCVVEVSGDLSRHGEDLKIASSKLKVKAKIDLAGLVKAAIEYTFSRSKPEGEKATGNRGAASATGDFGAASATGNYGAASATGDRGAASATGNYGAASATGNQGAASATGNQGAASATGYQGAASATGYQGAASATGYRGRAMGKKGNALFLVHRDDEYEITHAWAGIVGQNGIEEGVWYTLGADGLPVVVD